MKTTWAVLLASVLSVPAAAQSANEVGVGVVVGDPIGGSAKVWLDNNVAFDLGVGYSGETVFWGDVLYHMWNLFPQPSEGKLGVYLGAGPRLETNHDAEFALRTIGGVSWRLARQPLEFFAEAGPIFRMTPRGGVGADIGAGVRLYLGRK